MWTTTLVGRLATPGREQNGSILSDTALTFAPTWMIVNVVLPFMVIHWSKHESFHYYLYPLAIYVVVFVMTVSNIAMIIEHRPRRSFMILVLLLNLSSFVFLHHPGFFGTIVLLPNFQSTHWALSWHHANR